MIPLRSSLPKILGLALGAGLFGAAHAQTSSWTYAPGANQNAAAGRIESVSTAYDAGKQELSWSASFSRASGKLPNAFWLVVSDGPIPRGTPGQYAIFYFDATAPGAPKLSAYGYNGVNGDDSYRDGASAPGVQAPDRIASSLTSDFAKSLTVTDSPGGVRTLGFRADVSGINAYRPANAGDGPWEGARLGAKAGVWFHPLGDARTEYTPSGFLSSLSYGSAGWLDIEGQRTTAVPEPATLAVLGVGALGLARRRRAR